MALVALGLLIARWQTCTQLLLAGLLTVLLHPLSPADGLLQQA